MRLDAAAVAGGACEEAGGGGAGGQQAGVSVQEAARGARPQAPPGPPLLLDLLRSPCVVVMLLQEVQSFELQRDIDGRPHTRPLPPPRPCALTSPCAWKSVDRAMLIAHALMHCRRRQRRRSRRGAPSPAPAAATGWTPGGRRRSGGGAMRSGVQMTGAAMTAGNETS